MKLWLISQDVNSGYDTYDSAVVAAETPEDARKIHPSGIVDDGGVPWYSDPCGCSSSWTANLDAIKVELLGSALYGTKAGVICASFNAG